MNQSKQDKEVGGEKQSVDGEQEKKMEDLEEDLRPNLERFRPMAASFSGETFPFGRRKRRITNTVSLSHFESPKPIIDMKQSYGTPMVEPIKPKRLNTFFHGYRFLVVLLGGCSMGSMMLLRYNISVAIIRMVNQTAIYLEEHPTKGIDDFLAEGYSLGGEFDWNNEVQQMLMSWYMIGYSLPQFPMTKLALKLGIRKSIFISLIFTSISTFLSPCASYLGWRWLLALRLMNGVCSSAILPLAYGLIENWLPTRQYSLGLTLTNLLAASTHVVIPLLVGYLAFIDWTYAFYVPAIMTTIFSFIWLIFVTDYPEENKFISEKELATISDSGIITTYNKNQDKKQVKAESNTSGEQKLVEPKQRASWTCLFKVPSFYAYMIIWCIFCSSFAGFTFVLPTYLRQFLKVDVETNGAYCGLIQLGCVVSVLLPHLILRILTSKKINLSVTNSARFTQLLISTVVGATFIIVGCYHQLQVVLFFINRAFHSGNDIVIVSTLMTNFGHLGLSSIAFSIVNTIGNFSVTFASTLIGYVLDYSGQSEEVWSWILIVLGIGQFFITIIFCTIIRSNPVEIKKQNNEDSYPN